MRGCILGTMVCGERMRVPVLRTAVLRFMERDASTKKGYDAHTRTHGAPAYVPKPSRKTVSGSRSTIDDADDADDERRVAAVAVSGLSTTCP